MRLRLFLLSALLVLLGVTTRANAGQFVEFESGWGQTNQVRLIGYLARPPGAGPFPAVVVLHGCGGFHSEMLSWADRLRSWGYVALAVDSFGPRGFENACAKGSYDQPADAFRALQLLKRQPFVRGDDVAVMGFSMGASAVLAALERGSIARMVLIGELDDWTRAPACRAMAAGVSDIAPSRMPGDRSMVQLVVYPGARHGFIYADLRFLPGIEVLGHRIEYNDAATRDSIEQVRSFFQRTLSHQ
jgi:dienelactone hydrolase